MSIDATAFRHRIEPGRADKVRILSSILACSVLIVFVFPIFQQRTRRHLRRTFARSSRRSVANVTVIKLARPISICGRWQRFAEAEIPGLRSQQTQRGACCLSGLPLATCLRQTSQSSRAKNWIWFAAGLKRGQCPRRAMEPMTNGVSVWKRGGSTGPFNRLNALGFPVPGCRPCRREFRRRLRPTTNLSNPHCRRGIERKASRCPTANGSKNGWTKAAMSGICVRHGGVSIPRSVLHPDSCSGPQSGEDLQFVSTISPEWAHQLTTPLTSAETRRGQSRLSSTCDRRARTQTLLSLSVSVILLLATTPGNRGHRSSKFAAMGRTSATPEGLGTTLGCSPNPCGLFMNVRSY